MERILAFEEALAEVLHHAAKLRVTESNEAVSLLEAQGRTLASGVRASRDQPPFPRSTRDGFAVRSDDIHERARFHLLGSVRAGQAWRGEGLQSGQAIEIMTGAPLPAGADAVLMVEHTTWDGEKLLPAAGRAMQPGENVVTQGAEARAGQELIPAGRQIGPAEIALAAACGYADLNVYARSKVAIVATGDELLELPPSSPAEPQALEPWQIYNSNSYALAALVRAEGGEPVRLPIARDTAEDLRARLQAGREHDLLLFSGGVSMGRYDLVEPVLAEAGAEFLFTGALIQPGKPIVFGRLPRAESPSATQQVGESARPWTYFFGLPGNPVSTEACFRLFVAPLLRALTGQTELQPRFVEARLAESVRGGSKVTRFLPAEVQGNWQRVTVRPVAWQGSGDLAANARANGFVVLPSGTESFATGETVRVLLR